MQYLDSYLITYARPVAFCINRYSPEWFLMKIIKATKYYFEKIAFKVLAQAQLAHALCDKKRYIIYICLIFKNYLERTFMKYETFRKGKQKKMPFFKFKSVVPLN